MESTKFSKKRTRNELSRSNKRNAVIIGIGLFIVIVVTIWTVYRFFSLLD